MNLFFTNMVRMKSIIYVFIPVFDFTLYFHCPLFLTGEF